MDRFGYNGRIAMVDLPGGTTRVLEPGEDWYRIHGGGGLLGAALLMKETEPGLDALSPENILIFTSSVVAGQPAPGLARYSVVCKSPLTGGIAETRCEGPFGSFLKGSGFDAIAIRGRAERPSWLLAEGGRIRLMDAGDLWGKDSLETAEAIRSRLGRGDVSVAAIGRAGENLVRYASIVADGSIQAMRMGVGAVMGSKNLKAFALAGRILPPCSDEALVARVRADFARDLETNTLSKWQRDPPGFAAYADLSDVETAYLGQDNYRSDVHESLPSLARNRFLDHYAGELSCPGCPNNCIKILDSRGRPDPASAIHQEVTAALGPNVGNHDLGLLLEINRACNLLGLDPVSLGFSISFAMECFEEGLLEKADCAGLEPRFGNSAVLMPMMEMVASRVGIGDILADGVKRASARIGKGSERFALHVKGLEMVPFEPRTMTNLALGYATAPVGPRYDICEHDWDYDVTAGWGHTLELSRTLGILERIPMQHVGPDKVRNYKALNTIWSACDALDICVFASAPTRALSLGMMTDLVAGITGWKTSSWEIMRFGERRNNLLRLYNLREGLRAKDDTLPDRFFDEPVGHGRFKGHRLDRQAFGEAVRTYYEMMGWDGDGRPLPGTLLDLRLETYETQRAR
jgi:aldehyde:ferredoxin oxidoreductase